MKEQNMIGETHGVMAVVTNPHFGIITGGSATVLWLIGVITPYIAFAALVCGLGASVYTIYSQYQRNKRDNLK